MMKNFLHKITIAFLLAVLVCGAFFAPKADGVCRAENVYTNVLDDLKKDSKFNAENYPQNDKDYSLKLLQLAESAEKELFVYVYQPSGKSKDYRASYIKLSTTINDNISFIVYRLEYLNSDGVFYKYKVRDFEVKDEKVRYYAVTSLHRPFDKDVDSETGEGQIVNHTPFDVSKQYEFGEVNGKPYVNCVDIETIVVTDKFVGFVRYPDGYKLYVGACDAHFVAFNTNKQMDKLLECDIYYTSQSYSRDFYLLSGEKETFGEVIDSGKKTLKYDDKVEYDGGGLFAKSYKWDRIQTVEDFIGTETRENIYAGALLNVKAASTLTDSALAELQGKKWVLRFAETNYSFVSQTGANHTYTTLVGDVTILRLKFETDGVTYNLGVIDNFQSGSKEPSNETKVDVDLTSQGKTLLGLLMTILLIVLFAPVLPYIVRGAFWIVSLPFRAISAVRRSVKRRK